MSDRFGDKHKDRLGPIQGKCQKCGENPLELEYVDGVLMCELCKKTYQNNLAGPSQTEALLNKKEWFDSIRKT